MLKTHAKLEVKIGERVYELHLPADSPLGEAHDALYQMRNFIINKIIEAQNVDKPKEPDLVPPEFPPTDVAQG